MTKEAIKKQLDLILKEFNTAESYYSKEGIVAAYLIDKNAVEKVKAFAKENGILFRPFATIHLLLILDEKEAAFERTQSHARKLEVAVHALDEVRRHVPGASKITYLSKVCKSLTALHNKIKASLGIEEPKKLTA